MKKSVLIFVIFIILLLVALIVVKCVQDGVAEPDPYQSRQPVVSSGEKTSVTVYYLSADQLYLLPLTMDIPATTAPAQVAMERLLAEEEMYALVVDPSEGCDTGTPAAWAATNARMALEDPAFAEAFREELGEKGERFFG